MNAIYKYLVALVMMTFVVYPVLAEEDNHHGCSGDATVEAGQMGLVDEETLQAHIDKVKVQMGNVHRARAFHGSHKIELKQHLSQMQSAMQALHDQMYAEGCNGAKNAASIESRVEVIEKRMKMMQEMMQQVIDHMSEQEQ